jgi:uncharacterized protein involved in exopolysaccharide biosynthesis
MSSTNPSPAREEITLGELLGVARRRARWLVAGLIAGLAAAFVWLRVVPLEFEARGLLLFQGERPPGELLAKLDPSGGLGLLAGSGTAVAGEIEALRARPLLGSVQRLAGPLAPEGRCVQVDDLARANAWQALLGRPDPIPALALEVLTWPFPPEEPEGLRLEFLPGNRLVARREGLFGARSEALPYRLGEPLDLLGARLIVRAGGELDGRVLRVRCPTLARAADELREHLRVAEEPSGSAAVRISFVGPDGERAQALVNRLMAGYLEEHQARRRRLAGRPVEFLEAELARARGELARAEASLQAFGEERGALALPGAASELVKKLSDVDLQRAKLELELGAAEEVLARVRSGELSSDELAALEATGVFQHDLVEPLIGLVARRARLAREFTPAHPDVAQADAAIAQRVTALEGVLETERWKRAQASENMDGLVQEYLGELDAFPAMQVALARERRAVEASTQIYLFLLGRIEAARIEQASAVPSVDVLEWAEPPYEPSGAGLLQVLFVALALGLLSGLGGALLREYQERPLVSPSRAEALLGVECLPLSRRRERSAEALRTVRALLPRGSEATRTLLVVPVGPRAREGELAAELARACAQSGERVLLADADARGGRLHERFELASAPGLGELLSGGGGDKALQRTAEPGLTLVARGGGRLASVDGLARCLARWRTDYDRVLVSAPPLARSAEAYELATSGMGCVLVLAGAGEEELVRVARRLSQCGARTAAAVLQT